MNLFGKLFDRETNDKAKDLSEFEKWLKKARKNKDEQLPFVWQIMRSPFVEYHYSLLKDKSLDKTFRRDLMFRFDEHHEEGQALLLSKLDNNEDIEMHAEIIYMLGKLNDRRNRPDREKVIDHTKKLALSLDDYVRDRAIIVLGWIGGVQDIPLLADRLLNDTNSECRAWAASSFMQMWFRNECEKFVTKSLPCLYQAIKQENDCFVLGSILNTMQEMTKKRIGLSQLDIENINIKKIENAKLKAHKYFKELYNE